MNNDLGYAMYTEAIPATGVDWSTLVPDDDMFPHRGLQVGGRLSR